MVELSFDAKKADNSSQTEQQAAQMLHEQRGVNSPGSPSTGSDGDDNDDPNKEQEKKTSDHARIATESKIAGVTNNNMGDDDNENKDGGDMIFAVKTIVNAQDILNESAVGGSGDNKKKSKRKKKFRMKIPKIARIKQENKSLAISDHMVAQIAGANQVLNMPKSQKRQDLLYFEQYVRENIGRLNDIDACRFFGAFMQSMIKLYLLDSETNAFTFITIRYENYGMNNNPLTLAFRQLRTLFGSANTVTGSTFYMSVLIEFGELFSEFFSLYIEYVLSIINNMQTTYPNVELYSEEYSNIIHFYQSPINEMIVTFGVPTLMSFFSTEYEMDEAIVYRTKIDVNSAQGATNSLNTLQYQVATIKSLLNDTLIPNHDENVKIHENNVLFGMNFSLHAEFTHKVLDIEVIPQIQKKKKGQKGKGSESKGKNKGKSKNKENKESKENEDNKDDAKDDEKEDDKSKKIKGKKSKGDSGNEAKQDWELFSTFHANWEVRNKIGSLLVWSSKY